MLRIIVPAYKQDKVKEIIKFTLASMSSFLLDYALFGGLMLFLPHTSAVIAASNIGARVVSAFYNYSMNCRYVFHRRRRVTTAAEYFVLAAIILALNNIVLGLLTQTAGLSVYPAKLITECVLFIISWLIQKQVIFSKKTGIALKA